ncbi:MAG: hypothetical protein Q6364_14430 [Candidatus Hermodarchaeota archaeon]|nr:hypothetical protein [Candidatus Hermodarchaeota archaeon]
MSEPEKECFGLPYGSAICGLIIGVIIILWALSYFIPALQIIWTLWWPILLLIVGVLIIAGALYGMFRGRRR